MDSPIYVPIRQKMLRDDSFIIRNSFDFDKRNLMTENRCRIVVRKVRIEHPCGVFMNGIKDRL